MTNSDDIAEALRSLESQAPRPDVALALVQAEKGYGASRIAASTGRFTRWRTPLATAAAVIVIGAGLTIAVAGSGRHDAVSAPAATTSAAAVTSSATAHSTSRTGETTGSNSAATSGRPVGATDPWAIGPMPTTLGFTLTPRAGWTVRPVTVLRGYASIGEYGRAGNSIQIALISQQAFQQSTTVRGSTPATVDGHAGYLAELASTDARSTYGPNSDSPDKVRTLVLDVGSDRQLVLQGWPTATDAQLLAAAHRVKLVAAPLVWPYRFDAPLTAMTVFGFTNGGSENTVWLAPTDTKSWTDRSQVSRFGLARSGLCTPSPTVAPTTKRMTAPGVTLSSSTVTDTAGQPEVVKPVEASGSDF
ncbi:MAG: hypothetical protein ACR2P2_14080 [Nakamurella sp.]